MHRPALSLVLPATSSPFGSQSSVNADINGDINGNNASTQIISSLDRLTTSPTSSLPITRISLTSSSPLKAKSRQPARSAVQHPTRLHSHTQYDDYSSSESCLNSDVECTGSEGHDDTQPRSSALPHSRPPLSPYRTQSFSSSAPSLVYKGQPLDLSLITNENTFYIDASARLQLTPLQEVNSPPLMSVDSPAKLTETQQDPFLKASFVGPPSPTRDVTFYYALVELVRTEYGYTQDLTDLVEVS